MHLILARRRRPGSGLLQYRDTRASTLSQTRTPPPPLPLPPPSSPPARLSSPSCLLPSPKVHCEIKYKKTQSPYTLYQEWVVSYLISRCSVAMHARDDCSPLPCSLSDDAEAQAEIRWSATASSTLDTL
eukprot:96224-Rhodomonas_salina.1